MAKKTLQELLAEMKVAADESEKKANELANPILKSIHKRADALSKVFDDLNLTDKATYDALKKIVDSETRKNIAIANVVKRLEALGAVGKKVAASISGLTGAGALAVVGEALGKRK